MSPLPFEAEEGYIENVVSEDHVISSARGLTVGLFGSFYPYVNSLGPTSTSLAYLLSNEPEVERITVFAPRGSQLLPSSHSDKIEVIQCWTPGRPTTLVRAFKEIQKSYRDLDALLFNIYVSMFGRSAISNGLGLFVPYLVSRLSQRPAFVYMHNFLETQDASALGYSLNALTRHAAGFLEGLLVASTGVIVPLRSQKSIVDQRFGIPVQQFFVPYLEGTWALSQVPQSYETSHHDKRFTVLLFGSWGPQKDIRGVVRVVKRLFNLVPEARLVFAGSIHKNFPEYAEVIESAFGTLPKDRLEMHIDPPDSVVAQLALTTDVLVLPYTATGGYSAVMNVAGLFGTRIVAYDLPQLRETASMLGEDVQFVESGNEEALLSTLLKEAAATTRTGIADRLTMASAKLERSRLEVRHLISVLASAGPRRR